VAYLKEDIDRWFEYSYSPSQRLIHIGSHTPETDSTGTESGTDCQMSEFFLKAMIHLNRVSKTKPIVIHMNNLGGDWYHGMAMYDAIRACKAHVYGVCWGYAMSMGSIIIQACDSRIVAPHCSFMIHDGYEAYNGTCRSFEAWGDHAKEMRRRMYEIYLSRMKPAKPRTTIKTIEKMCSHDKIFSAQDAVDQGLADWVMEQLDDPERYYATETQNAKWQSGMKLGKHESEEESEE